MVKGEKFTKHLSKFDKVFIQQKLDEGLTSKMISEIVEIPGRRLGEMIKHFGLTVINKCTTHIVDHNYFDKIDTEERAYFLGFLVADGCVTKDLRKSGFLSKRITFSNSIWDKEIIEKFRDTICPSIEIKWKNNSTETIKRRDQSSFKFTSEHMFNTLVDKYRINERKTHDTDFLMVDLGQYMIHFIRGFMDGDGHVRKGSVSFVFTSIPFMKQLEEFFLKEGFNTFITNKQGKTVDYYHLYIRMTNCNVHHMFNLLYGDATIYLNRKKDKFFEIFDNIKRPCKEIKESNK